MSKKEIAAIQRIKEFASSKIGGVWPKIRKAELVKGMKKRIENPNLIAQRQAPLCGPAVLARSLAKDKPLFYVNAIIDLYTYGRTQINNLRIEAGSELKNDGVHGNTNPADWILLASIRDSDNWIFSPAGWVDSIAGTTLPYSIEDWFRDVGYTIMVNKTYLFTKYMPTKRYFEAKEASNLYKKGYKVLMFINANMLKPPKQNEVSLFPNHWVILNSEINGDGLRNRDASISFSVYSWGSSRPYRLNMRSFLYHYFGFIAMKH